MKKTVSLIFAFMLCIMAVTVTGCGKKETRYTYLVYKDNFGNEYRLSNDSYGYENDRLYLEYGWQEKNLIYTTHVYYLDNDNPAGIEAGIKVYGYTKGMIDLTELGEYGFLVDCRQGGAYGSFEIRINVVDTRPMPEYKFIPHNYNSKYQWVDCVPNEQYIYKYTGDYIVPPELVLMEDDETLYTNFNVFTVEKFNGTEFIDRDEAEDSSGWRKDVGRYRLTYTCTNTDLPEEYQNKYCYEINVSIELEIIE